MGTDGDNHVLRGPEGSTHDHDPWLTADRLRHAIVNEALAGAHDVVDLHSAAVERDGSALLLAGPSGAGKTTMTMEFVERGWSLLSDDVAPIRVEDHKVLPFPKPIGLRDVATWQRLESCWDPPGWPVRPRGSLQVPAHVLGAPQSDPQGVGAFVLLRLTRGGPTRFTEVSTARALAESGPFSRKMSSSSVSVLRRTLEQARCAQLEFGGAEAGAEMLSSRLFRGIN